MATDEHTQAAPPDFDTMPISWELSYGSDDEEEAPTWRVHRRQGSRNDREWVLLGSGKTPSAALAAARGVKPAAQPPTTQAEASWMEQQLDRLATACHERGAAIQRTDTDRAGQWLAVIDDCREALRIHLTSATTAPARPPILQRIADILEDGEGPDLHDLLTEKRPRLSEDDRRALGVIVRWAYINQPELRALYPSAGSMPAREAAQAQAAGSTEAQASCEHKHQKWNMQCTAGKCQDCGAAMVAAL